eukprot:1847384-Amphidinium_carterae.1
MEYLHHAAGHANVWPASNKSMTKTPPNSRRSKPHVSNILGHVADLVVSSYINKTSMGMMAEMWKIFSQARSADIFDKAHTKGIGSPGMSESLSCLLALVSVPDEAGTQT